MVLLELDNKGGRKRLQPRGLDRDQDPTLIQDLGPAPGVPTVATGHLAFHPNYEVVPAIARAGHGPLLSQDRQRTFHVPILLYFN